LLCTREEQPSFKTLIKLLEKDHLATTGTITSINKTDIAIFIRSQTNCVQTWQGMRLGRQGNSWGAIRILFELGNPLLGNNPLESISC
jgi:hypothetical protein